MAWIHKHSKRSKPLSTIRSVNQSAVAATCLADNNIINHPRQYHSSSSPESCRLHHRLPPAAHPSPWLHSSLPRLRNNRMASCRCSASLSRAGRRSSCALVMMTTMTTTLRVACAVALTYTATTPRPTIEIFRQRRIERLRPTEMRHTVGLRRSERERRKRGRGV